MVQTMETQTQMQPRMTYTTQEQSTMRTVTEFIENQVPRTVMREQRQVVQRQVPRTTYETIEEQFTTMVPEQYMETVAQQVPRMTEERFTVSMYCSGTIVVNCSSMV